MSGRLDVWAQLALQQENRARQASAALKAEEAKEGQDAEDGKPDGSGKAGEGDASSSGAAAGGAPKPESTYMLFLGTPGAGKSSMVQAFLGTASTGDKKPKPTVALEYTYGRRSNAAGGKDLCQIWELGGGERLKELIPVVLTPAREKHACAVVCVDLSRPDSCLDEAVRWCDIVRAASRRVPIVVLGCKYDLFENQDSLKRKALCQALRYACCERQAGLIFATPGDKNAMGYVRAVLGHYAFLSDKKKSFYVDPNKPIVVAQGRDRADKIGLPAGLPADAPPKKVLQAFRDILKAYFPAPAAEDNPAAEPHEDEAKQGAGAGADGARRDELQLAPEPVVDARRAQKDLELEQYRAQVQRKLRLDKA
jgi:dynein light intermediate chain 2